MDKKVYEFISAQANDPIIEWRTCKASGEAFPIYQGEKDLLEQLSPTIAGEKMNYSLPQYCYWVRMIQRMTFRNERKLYSVACQGFDKKEISIVHDSIRRLMPVQEWHNEDFSKYGIPYSGDFPSDVKRLLESVPYLPRLVINSENSEYCNQSLNEKNCYLNAGGQDSEDCLYCLYDARSKYGIDSFATLKSEIIYRSIHVRMSMKSFFATYLLNCYNVRFAYDLQNCKNILFGVALRNKEYIFKNKQYTKEEREAIFLTYSKKIKTISGLQEVLAEYQEFKNTCPHECTHNLNEEKSRGTQINNSNGIILSFGTEKSHDCRYCGNEGFAQNVMDVDLCSFSQLSYNSIGSTKTYGCACMGSNFGEIRDSYYGFYTRGGNNLLGCFGVQNKSYYILNKEYPKEERENLAQQIIQELIDKEARGKFFATELSPFPYNDTQANKFFPIRQLKIGDTTTIIDPNGIGGVEVLHPEQFISDALLDLGGEEKLKIKWRTQESEINIPTNVDVLQVADLPDNIDDATQEICNKVIICEKTGRPFRIMPMEFDFYKQYGLPLPTTHYEYRDVQIYKEIPLRFLDLDTCDKCGKEVLKEHRPEHTYKMYCVECYNKEIYG